MLSRFTKTHTLFIRWVHHSSATARKNRETITCSDLEEDESEDSMLEDESGPEYLDTPGSEEEPYHESTPQMAQNASGSTVSICLPTVHLPKPLERAMQVVLDRHNKKEHVKDGAALSQYLYNRIPVGCEWINNENNSTKKMEMNGKVISQINSTD